MNPIESIEVIPMNKESIFDAPYVEVPATLEEGGTTLNAELWLETQTEIAKNEMNMQFPAIGSFRHIDLQTSKWFSTKFPNTQYMLGPVAVIDYNGCARTLTAKTRKVTDFAEFLNFIDNRKIYLYQILFHANMPVLITMDEKFEASIIDCPKINDKAGFWVIRYAEIEGENNGN